MNKNLRLKSQVNQITNINQKFNPQQWRQLLVVDFGKEIFSIYVNDKLVAEDYKIKVLNLEQTLLDYSEMAKDAENKINSIENSLKGYEIKHHLCRIDYDYWLSCNANIPGTDVIFI